MFLLCREVRQYTSTFRSDAKSDFERMFLSVRLKPRRFLVYKNSTGAILFADLRSGLHILDRGVSLKNIFLEK